MVKEKKRIRMYKIQTATTQNNSKHEMSSRLFHTPTPNSHNEANDDRNLIGIDPYWLACFVPFNQYYKYNQRK